MPLRMHNTWAPMGLRIDYPPGTNKAGLPETKQGLITMDGTSSLPGWSMIIDDGGS